MEPEITAADKAYSPQGFLMSLKAWRSLGLDDGDWPPEALAQGPGRVRFARHLTGVLNTRRGTDASPVRYASAGELLAAGLLTDILRHLATQYCTQVTPGAMRTALDWIRERTAPIVVDRTLPAFAGLFPPPEVRAGKCTEAIYLSRPGTPLSNTECATRELMLLWISTQNPALSPYKELFDDGELRERSPYVRLVEHLSLFFKNLPMFPGYGMTLWDLLNAPMRACPDSVEGQLDFMRVKWGGLLPEFLMERLAVAQGVLREETRMRGFGTGETPVLQFGPGFSDMGYEEFEAFSRDLAWMPNLVLIAKTVYVWLDQLSKKYERPIRRLDEIPDEELDRLAHWGFTGLWLIGLWERSVASETIKKRMGNPEAASSAYSLYDYTIAEDLGGDEACNQLAARAWRRGIRLASDMVPNHVGLYSKWVVEHPDWFIQLPYTPFPSYQFTGPDLSPDERVGLYIEDGYWNHSDAAVVFKRVDAFTGDTRYIYHGNDGTHMPWNDTAQLNYLIPEVREAVVQTILHVARKFPVIRFDAAMTLAKKHYQRLWFPQPQDAGAIPSRAEHGLNRPDFDAVFPVEFWREVVDRVAQEAPDTLLLAEAFWLMEGYFVRTLGMHRVYNSAFMNMLKMEENQKYRMTIKNVLEFSPEVLQRFVNFMNNPDEDTAEAQFGRGDKYFGVAVLMATMPGLPMFGHGQIEGFTEKYGMEYRRAYWDESVDEGLVARHEREIFPLLRQRRLFSGAANFALFDFETGYGVDENVFAYSNRVGRDRALVVYNNAYPTTSGALRMSSAINVGSVDKPFLKRVSLREALDLNTSESCYYIVRDTCANLEYLYYAPDIARHGLPFELHGYQYRVLVDWRERHDFDLSWGRLHGALAGRGVPSVDEAYIEMHLTCVLEPFRALMTSEMLRNLFEPHPKTKAFLEAMTAFLLAVSRQCGHEHDTGPEAHAVLEGVRWLRGWDAHVKKAALYPETRAYLDTVVASAVDGPLSLWRVPMVWLMIRDMGRMAAPPNRPECVDITATSGAWMREWLLVKQIARAFTGLDEDHWRAEMDARLVRVCVLMGRELASLQHQPWAPVLDRILSDPHVREFLGVHTFGGRQWMNKEQLERMLGMVFLTQAIDALLRGEALDADALMLCQEDIHTLLEAAEDAGYDLDGMFNSLK